MCDCLLASVDLSINVVFVVKFYKKRSMIDRLTLFFMIFFKSTSWKWSNEQTRQHKLDSLSFGDWGNISRAHFDEFLGGRHRLVLMREKSRLDFREREAKTPRHTDFLIKSVQMIDMTWHYTRRAWQVCLLVLSKKRKEAYNSISRSFNSTFFSYHHGNRPPSRSLGWLLKLA